MENDGALPFSILHSPFRVHVYPLSADAQQRVPTDPIVLRRAPRPSPLTPNPLILSLLSQILAFHPPKTSFPRIFFLHRHPK